MSKKAILYRMKTDQHVCPYGLKSRDLLLRNGFDIDDNLLTTRQEVDAFKAKHDVETTPQTFIGDERIGGYSELRRYFGKASAEGNSTNYTPVIAIFAMTWLMATALVLSHGFGFLWLAVIETFVALSMCVLAIQKLRDLSAFSMQFITYDLIAMRYVPYAYIYAFAEAFSGLGMLAGLAPWLVATPALLIGAVGAGSVIKAVYIDRRELKCACVGGNSKVPLGFVSLTENVMMVAMAVWMLVK